jgi:hypothetical protein
VEGQPPSVKVAFFGLEPWKVIHQLSSLHGNSIKFSVFYRDQETLLDQNHLTANKFHIPADVTPVFIQNTWQYLNCDLLFIPYILKDVKVASCLSQLLLQQNSAIGRDSSSSLIITLGIPSVMQENSSLEPLHVLQQQIADHSDVNLFLRDDEGIFNHYISETELVEIISSISGLVLSPQMINLSFGDLKHALAGINNNGVIGFGFGNTGIKAAQAAVRSITNEKQVKLTSIKKILIAFSCNSSTGLDEIGKTVSFITQTLPSNTKIFWGLSASPSKQMKILLLTDRQDNQLFSSNTKLNPFVHESDSITNDAISSTILQEIQVFDDDLPEIDDLMNTGLIAGEKIVTASNKHDWNKLVKNISDNDLLNLKESDTSMYVFNEGGLLLAHVPEIVVATTSSNELESEPTILTGLLSAMQQISQECKEIGSELDSFKAGNKICVFKKMKIDDETILNGVVIYNSTRNEERTAIHQLNTLFKLVDLMYLSSVPEMCIKDRVDTILKERGILPDVKISAY